MDTADFERVQTSLASLLSEGVADLEDVTTVDREDGLPQDWVNDLVNLTPEQAGTLKNQLSEASHLWAVSLHGLL